MSITLGSEWIGHGKARTQVTIEVDGAGQFHAEFNDVTYSALTRKELMEQLTKAERKAREQKPVPVTVLGLVPAQPDKWHRVPDEPFEHGDGFVQALLRGEHERQHNVYLLLVDDKKKQKFQVSTYRREGATIARRLTDEETTRYLELATAAREAKAALEAYLESVQVSPDEVLRKARKPEAAS